MKCFKYTNRPKSYITVKTLHEPHGEGTDTVVSVGCTLKGDMQNPTWKVHIPIDLAESVGLELTRLARLDRETKMKQQRPHVKYVKEQDPQTSPTVPVPTLEEVRSHAERAVGEGRVIKRAKKE